MIKQNLHAIQSLITKFEKKYARSLNSVQLLAASKGQSVEKIMEAYDAGQTIFGENYLQEALKKMNALQQFHIEWHFIGPIQSNKTKKIAEHFAWVQSVSDIHHAQRLNDQRPAHLPRLNICIEVNIDHEATKSGVLENHVSQLAIACSQLPRLHLRGLMTVPAVQTSFEAQLKSFQKLHQLFTQLNLQGFQLDTLSMGMSDDFEAAIAAGTTLVRIGVGIFGKRE